MSSHPFSIPPIPSTGSVAHNRNLESRLDQSLDHSFLDRSLTGTGSTFPSLDPVRPFAVHRRGSSDGSTISSNSSGSSLPVPRAAPPHHMNIHQDISQNTGASPTSTAGHHVSRITLGAGIFQHPRGGESEGSGEEWDKERSLERLVRGIRGTSKPAAPTRQQQQQQYQHQPHKPKQPSPLRRSPLLPPPASSLGDASASLSYDQPPAGPSARSAERERHEDRENEAESTFTHLARGLQESLHHRAPASRGVLGPSGAENRRPLGGNNGKGKEKEGSKGLRVESGSHARPLSANAYRSAQPQSQTQRRRSPQPETVAPTPRYPAQRGALGDLTGLTGLLETPRRGLGVKGVGEDGAGVVAGEGDAIPPLLATIQTRLQHLETEKTSSTHRIRELEGELGRLRVQRGELERERARRGLVEKELEEVVGREREGREERVVHQTIIQRLEQDVANLTRSLDSAKQEVESLRSQLLAAASVSATATTRAPSPRASTFEFAKKREVDELTKRVERVEREWRRLSGIVEGARGIVEESLGELEGERTMILEQEEGRGGSSQPRKDSQYREGLKTAAGYTGRTPRSTTPSPATKPRPRTVQIESASDSEMSPSPQTSRVQERKRERRRSMHDSRSDEPQGDISKSPFPAIRGEELEKEFFSPPRRAAVRAEVAGNKEKTAAQTQQQQTMPATTGAKVEQLEKALSENEGRLPPQTVVMGVLREIEDDYGHYLSIYTELAEQYKGMSILSMKRNVLAEHLKEVIDTMEIKASQVARLTSVLALSDKSYKAPNIRRAFDGARERVRVPEGARAVRREMGGERMRHAVV